MPRRDESGTPIDAEERCLFEGVKERLLLAKWTKEVKEEVEKALNQIMEVMKAEPTSRTQDA